MCEWIHIQHPEGELYTSTDKKDRQCLKGEICEHFHDDSSVNPDISMTSKILKNKTQRTGRQDEVSGDIS